MGSIVTGMNYTFAVLTVIGQVVVVVFLLQMILQKKVIAPKHKTLLLISLIVATTAMLGSLFFSEVALYTPCKLCWLQRICMYPQVLLLGIAFWRKDYGIPMYSIPLAAIGAIIAAYHYLMQLSVAPATTCSVVQTESCAQTVTTTFGYITIPLMALTAFGLIMLAQFQIKKVSIDGGGK